MRWLSQLLTRLQGADSERGATATIVAVLLAGGVIMGMLAVSVDLGNLTYERRQLQNSADATSLALAQECAKDAANCTPAGVADVADLLDLNSRDDASTWRSDMYADGACASSAAITAGSTLPACTTTGDITSLIECPPVPTWASSIAYVETYTATETAGGDDKLFLPFSRVLAGGSSGDAGSAACARAAWGTPGGFTGALPVAFSRCEWSSQIEDGGGYVTEGPVGATATNPGYGGPGQPAWPQSDQEVVLQLKSGSTTPNPCSPHNNGMDVPGGFGWLEKGSGCEVKLWPFDWAHIKPGAAPIPCVGDLKHRVLDLPIFDCSRDAPMAAHPSPTDECDLGNGSNTYYHLAGWAKFYISGYKLTGSDPGTSAMPGGKSCTGSQRCIIGWFLSGTLADAPSIQAPNPDNDFGLHVIKPAG